MYSFYVKLRDMISGFNFTRIISDLLILLQAIRLNDIVVLVYFMMIKKNKDGYLSVQTPDTKDIY